jgi:predicted dinucleotide-binding enzyme
MTCVETVDGGKLKEAATKEAGDSILIQIGIESEIPQTLILL